MKLEYKNRDGENVSLLYSPELLDLKPDVENLINIERDMRKTSDGVCSNMLDALQTMNFEVGIEGRPETAYGLWAFDKNHWRDIIIKRVRFNVSFGFMIEVDWPRKDGQGVLDNNWSHCYLRFNNMRVKGSNFTFAGNSI